MSDEQNDERDVLCSIYEGDENFTQIDDVTFHYKVGDVSDVRKSFILSVCWPSNYPQSELPTLDLDLFYNKHVPDELKATIKSELSGHAEAMLGEAVTFTLFEFAKEQADGWVTQIPEISTATDNVAADDNDSGDTDSDDEATQVKTRQGLTKAQKRRMWDRGEGNLGGERERGSDWIDVVKHLNQTGGQAT